MCFPVLCLCYKIFHELFICMSDTHQGILSRNNTFLRTKILANAVLVRVGVHRILIYLASISNTMNGA